MTAYALEDQLQEARDHHVFAILQKPFPVPFLLQVVADAKRGVSELGAGSVLIVDDDPSMGETIVDILALRAIPAEAVTSGAAALDRVTGLHPAVAIVDFRLPDMTGVDLCGELKKGDADLSVMLLTGYASLESAIAAVRHVDEYLTKPVHPDELLRVVVALRERALLRRHNRALMERVQEANASLESSVAARTAELAGLVSIAEGAAAAPDLAALVSSLVEGVAAASGAAAAGLYLRDADTGDAWLAAQFGDGGFAVRWAGGGRDTVLQLIAGGEQVGSITLRGAPAASNDDYLRALAAQTAVAVQNMVRLQRERETVERLSELSRLKSSFLASVSHELRTPLAAVLGFAQMLAAKGDHLAAPDRLLLAGRVVNQAERLRDLIEDLLDVSRVEFGGFRVSATAVHLGDLLAELGADGAPHADRLDIRVPDDLPMVVADPVRLTQVLGNLVHNASKYSPPDSRIEIAAVADGTAVQVSVRDHGKGIEPAFLGRIFDPFSQADLGDTRRDSGLGLGLYVSRGLVEAMGGTIDVITSGDEGSTFRVRLPRADRDPSLEGVSAEPGAAG